MRKLLVVLALVGLTTLALAACGESTTTTQGTKVGTATPVPTNAPAAPPSTATPAKNTFAVGDVVSIAGYEVTVNSFKQVQPGEYDSPPPAGSVYAQLDLTLVNKTGKTQTVSSLLQFQLTAEDGSKGSETFLMSVSNNFGGTVVNGGKLRGLLIYEVPSSPSYTLQFQPEVFDTSQVAVWKLSL
jgi:flagellar basal body-associated protein FliL